MNLVFKVQWFRFGGWRCSPLNAALYFLLSKGVFNELRNLGNVFPSLSNCDSISRAKRIVSSQK
ncbi:hypothetical protein C1S83_24635 [Vibrio parahaemolyticus]|nr:hypothetical protein C1S83_24635 [Vibrio parahaemolyticus]